LGDIAHSLFVRSELRKIFSFRFQKTEELFGKWAGQELNVQFS
jgi:hypothetical protein